MIENKKIVYLLGQLIQHRENDLLMGIEDGEVTQETQNNFTNLILAVTRYLHDIRYCSNPKCQCSPENDIKQHYEPIKGYLQRTQYALYHIPWKTIEGIMSRRKPMNLNELFKLQAKLDHEIVEKHNLQGQDLKKRKILAAIVELGETANEGRWFKFWSTDQKARTNKSVYCSRCDEGIIYWDEGSTNVCDECVNGIKYVYNPLLEEYVDTIHFIISIALEHGYTEHTYTEPKQSDLTDRALDIVYLLSNLSYVQGKRLNNPIRLIFDYVIALGYQFGFDEDTVINAYLEKNEINHERQQSGY